MNAVYKHDQRTQGHKIVKTQGNRLLDIGYGLWSKSFPIIPRAAQGSALGKYSSTQDIAINCPFKAIKYTKSY